MRVHHAVGLFVLFALSLPSFGDTITGRVVDANGVGVAGIDIDVEPMSGGGNPQITNDGTDANGFFTSTLPAGVYRIHFKPPPPPATSLLTGVVENVVVVGTLNMGVITLTNGVAVSGRALDSVGIPIAGVKVVVTDVPTGSVLIMNNGSSNAFGNFSVAVPMHAVHVDLDPISVLGRTLVPQRFSLSPVAPVNLGNVTLLDGVILSGTFRNSAGLPVSGVDLDATDVVSGVKAFTPHDNSNSLGAYSLVLAPGTYDIEACPTFASRLVAVGINDLVLLSSLNAGIATLQTGVVLSGTVRDVNGTPLSGIDVDVRRHPGGAAVVTCNDNTNALGQYAVVVPIDTLTVGFALPGQHGTSGEDLHTGLTVTSNLTLDGALPAPTPNFAATPSSGLAPLVATFQDLSTGAVTGWSWNFGDFTTSTLPNPVHTYAANGSYTVQLTVTGPGGPNTLTRPGYIVVASEPPPVAEFVGTPTSGVAPLLVSFTNQSSGSVTSHSWSFGDGGSSTLASPSRLYTLPGTYTVALTETGPGGTNTRTRAAYIVVNEPPPVAEFGAHSVRGRGPLTVQFDDLSTGALTSWSWNFGDGQSASTPEPLHVYRQAGIYTVALTVSGPGGTDVETKSAFVVVHGPSPLGNPTGSAQKQAP